MNLENKCICPENAHDETCPVCIAGQPSFPNVYVLNLADYEAYQPIYFLSYVDEEVFTQKVRFYFEKVYNDLVSEKFEDTFGGEIFLERITNELVKDGFKKLIPAKEISLGHTCSSFGMKTPCNDTVKELVGEELWKKITEHNQKIWDDMDRRWRDVAVYSEVLRELDKVDEFGR